MENTFEKLYGDNLSALQRYIRFRVNDKFDCDDILQEVHIAAYRNFSTLKNTDAFKGWILTIARNKISGYFREKARYLEIPVENISDVRKGYGISGRTTVSVVRDTFEKLGDKDKQILYLYFWKEYRQSEIASLLGLPIGTVKSRLHSAKEHFKEIYPYHPKQKGAVNMKKLPNILPEYSIKKVNKPAFRVKWEEVMGWFIVPKEGERLSWAMYDMPSRERGELCEMSVVGKAEVHGIEGVEIVAVETDPMGCNSAGGQSVVERRFVAQLTDTHCRLLAESHTEGGIKRYYTFLDGDAFLGNWGFGEDNCGNETNISSKGDIVFDGNQYAAKEKDFLLDIVGRYEVTINGKTYDTVCIMDCYTYIDGAASLQYIDKNGKTVLWRRFNRNDWKYESYENTWKEMLPENDTVTVNGNVYVNWYDCITDYIV